MAISCGRKSITGIKPDTPLCVLCGCVMLTKRVLVWVVLKLTEGGRRRAAAVTAPKNKTKMKRFQKEGSVGAS